LVNDFEGKNMQKKQRPNVERQENGNTSKHSVWFERAINSFKSVLVCMYRIRSGS
jgi:hypothetical protein